MEKLEVLEKVMGAFEDDEENLWIGCETGELTRYSHGTFQSVDIPAWKGTKAAERAPSPNSRRKRLGRKKANWNASLRQRAPSQTIVMSRIIPRTRDSSVRPAISLAAPKKCSRSWAAGSPCVQL